MARREKIDELLIHYKRGKVYSNSMVRLMSLETRLSLICSKELPALAKLPLLIAYAVRKKNPFGPWPPTNSTTLASSVSRPR